MPHLTINGITIASLADTFRERPEHIGSVLERGMNGGLNETRAGRKRAWTFKTFYQLPAVGEAMRRLLEGDHQVFPMVSGFSSYAASRKGCTPKSGGSYTVGASYTEVASGSYVEWALAQRVGDFSRAGWDPTKGWTLAFRDVIDSSHYVVTGSVAVARGDGSGNPAGVSQYVNGGGPLSLGLSYLFHVQADGDVALHGYSTGGAAATRRYLEVLFFPFELPDASWASAIYTRAAAGFYLTYPSSPIVELAGDCVEDASVEVVGRVVDLPQGNVSIGGTHYNNARLLEVDLVEV